MENVLSLDWGVGYTCVYICQNSSNYILAFLCVSLYLNFTFKKKSHLEKTGFNLKSAIIS